MIKEHKWITNLPIKDNKEIQDIISNNNLEGIKVAKPMYEGDDPDLFKHINNNLIGIYATDDSDLKILWKKYDKKVNNYEYEYEYEYDENGNPNPNPNPTPKII